MMDRRLSIFCENDREAVSQGNQPLLNLPPYDQAIGTRRLLLIAFIMCLLLSIIELIAGCYMLIFGFCPPYGFEDSHFPPLEILTSCSQLEVSSSYTSKLLALLFTVVISICTECLGYVHSISLRWALAKEGKLEFNSNLRLFSSARFSIGNGQYANITSALCLVLCYGGASCAFIESGYFTGIKQRNVIEVYASGIIVTGAGLLGLCIITGVAWLRGEKKGIIKSWNPSTLNTALVCLHHGILSRNKVHQAPRTLRSRQSSAIKTIPGLKRINRFTMAISCMCVATGTTLMVALWRTRWSNPIPEQGYPWPCSGYVWSFFPAAIMDKDYMCIQNPDNPAQSAMSMNLQPVFLFGENIASYGLPFYSLVLWSVLWQSISTITLHIFELVVNLHRDEISWRKVANTNGKGAGLSENAFLAMLRSKGSVALFCLKPFGQWIYTLAIYTVDITQVGLNPLPFFVLAIVLGTMALTSVHISHHQPNGPLPSTYGHLQSIVDLVDDWGGGFKGRLYWGDKGPIAIDHRNDLIVCRHAGTSGDKEGVGEVVMDRNYSLY